MKHRKKILLTFVLILTMVFTMNSGMVSTLAEEDTQTSVNWTVSKSKTASPTELDSSNKTTTVTLSLPSAEEELSSDVVFVLDSSSCNASVRQSMADMLNHLYASVAQSQAKVNVGIVMYRGNAIMAYPLTEYTGDTTPITAALTQGLYNMDEPSGTGNPDALHGSNMPSGLDAATQMLNGDKSTANSRKHMILVSDGATYLYTHDNDPTTCYSRTSGYCSMNGSLFEYTAKYFPNNPTNGSLAKPANFTDWPAFLANISAKRANYTQYDAPYSRTDKGTSFTPTNPQCNATTVGDFIINTDESMYQAYTDFQALANSGINCYAVNASNSDMGIFTSFMNYLGGTVGKGISTDFSNIEKNIMYLIGSGSVTDYIGTDFDLVNNGTDCPFTLTMNGTALEVQKTGDNKWSFGTADNGVYPYVITYTPGDQESFVWQINVPVMNSQPMQLSYNLQLTADPKDAGTYTYPTNERAILDYTSSDGSTTGREEFEKPVVNYTVTAQPVTPTQTPTVTPTQTPTAAPTTAPTATPTAAPKNAVPAKTEAAKASAVATGDPESIIFWTIVLGVAAAGIAVAVAAEKKRKNIQK